MYKDVMLMDKDHYVLRGAWPACKVKSSALPRIIENYERPPRFEKLVIPTVTLHRSLRIGALHSGENYFLRSFWIIRNDLLSEIKSFNLPKTKIYPIKKFLHRDKKYSNYSVILFIEDAISGEFLNLDDCSFHVWYGDGRKAKKKWKFSSYKEIEKKTDECLGANNEGELVLTEMALQPSAQNLDLIPCRYSPWDRDVKVSSRLYQVLKSCDAHLEFFDVGEYKYG